MPCRPFHGGILCTPALAERAVIRDVCPWCKEKQDILREIYDWYGANWTCLWCGAEWTQDEMKRRSASERVCDEIIRRAKARSADHPNLKGAE